MDTGQNSMNRLVKKNWTSGGVRRGHIPSNIEIKGPEDVSSSACDSASDPHHARKMPRFVTQSIGALETKYNLINREERQKLREASSEPGSEYSSVISRLKENSKKNRYSDVLPYDRNRVKLDVSQGHSDYINASHVKVETDQTEVKSYIASQGPLASTMAAFWQMCYSETKSDTIVIVMVTPISEGGSEKCYKYWNDQGSLEIPANGGFRSSLQINHVSSQNVENHFILTELEVVPDDRTMSPKRCFHLYYYNWADFSAPSSFGPIVLLSNMASDLRNRSDRTDPIVTHCSAGVGRTGTFITLDYLLTNGSGLLSNSMQLFQDEERSNLTTPSQDQDPDPIFQIVRQLRSQRLMMVQRFEQFVFLYKSSLRYYLDVVVGDKEVCP
ncbi:unnamed protein product [Kuraishia capsulata CBS 1993]|uniref:Tyrosine specific protein phosphatases domain-containing protein n=1 Tax=Kuraishia capsulata CBS 1993 TaxID=1382522 RepID=W6MQW3_9ASCO|nr:uncharacterized protein KUCA_T00005053001 [Kuraishia capsulata CBS 1993]CDK29066.1 unnamed protein product [Kuraishia capsulata CBS 1993]